MQFQLNEFKVSGGFLYITKKKYIFINKIVIDAFSKHTYFKRDGDTTMTLLKLKNKTEKKTTTVQ